MRVLGAETDHAPNVVSGEARDVGGTIGADQLDAPGGWLQEPDEHGREGALARSARTGHQQPVARFHFDVGQAEDVRIVRAVAGP